MTISLAELRTLHVDELIGFGTRLGLPMEGVETSAQALTRLIGSAYRVEA